MDDRNPPGGATPGAPEPGVTEPSAAPSAGKTAEALAWLRRPRFTIATILGATVLVAMASAGAGPLYRMVTAGDARAMYFLFALTALPLLLVLAVGGYVSYRTTRNELVEEDVVTTTSDGETKVATAPRTAPRPGVVPRGRKLGEGRFGTKRRGF